MNSSLRVLIASGAIGAWLALFLGGWTLGGGIHLLLAAALLFFPWRLMGQ